MCRTVSKPRRSCCTCVDITYIHAHARMKRMDMKRLCDLGRILLLLLVKDTVHSFIDLFLLFMKTSTEGMLSVNLCANE